MSGEVGLPYRTAYCASKYAVNGFFESLRIETDPEKISITIICPPSVFFKITKLLKSLLGEKRYEISSFTFKC